VTDTNQKQLGSTLWSIAAFLTSLGVLIAAPTPKHAALKTHKKGLNLGRWPGLVWQRAVGPESGRANGASPYQPRATPQEYGPGGGGGMSVAFMSSGGMDRAFSLHRIHLAMNLGRWPRLVWQRAFGPESGRANGASLYQPGAAPQEYGPQKA
jgi:hypothetical protein